MLLPFLAALSALPTAQARSSCKALKPDQPADDAMMAVVNGAIDSAKLYLSGGTADISRGEVSQLQDDALAKAWFIYQICTLTEAELLSQEKAEELVELVLVGAATDEAAAPSAETASAPATISAPSGERAVAVPRAAPAAAGRPLPDRLPRGKATGGSAPDPFRRAFVMANRDSLPDINAWLPHLEAVQACGGGSTTLTVAAEGTITAQGDAADCILGVAEGLSWTPGTYTVIVP